MRSVHTWIFQYQVLWWKKCLHTWSLQHLYWGGKSAPLNLRSHQNTCSWTVYKPNMTLGADYVIIGVCNDISDNYYTWLCAFFCVVATHEKVSLSAVWYGIFLYVNSLIMAWLDLEAWWIVYIIRYSWTNTSKFPTRESFSQAAIEAWRFMANMFCIGWWALRPMWLQVVIVLTMLTGITSTWH